MRMELSEADLAAVSDARWARKNYTFKNIIKLLIVFLFGLALMVALSFPWNISGAAIILVYWVYLVRSILRGQKQSLEQLKKEVQQQGQN